MQTVYHIAGLLIYIAVGLAPPFILKGALAAKAGLGKLTGRLDSASKGLTGKTQEWARRRPIYQNAEFARNQKKARIARQSSARIADVAAGEGWQADRMRRKAGGRTVEGQNRVRIAGIAELGKLEHEEAQQGATLIEHNRITDPMQLAELVKGGTATGVDGKTLSGADNKALQLAALQKIIKAQDAKAIEALFLDAGTDKGMLVSELQKESNYSTSKGAGAHLVQMTAKQYTQPEIDLQAASSMSALKADALAAQDGPAWQSAERGFRAGAGNAATLTERQALWDQVEAISKDPRAYNNVKGSAQIAYKAILAAGKPIV